MNNRIIPLVFSFFILLSSLALAQVQGKVYYDDVEILFNYSTTIASGQKGDQFYGDLEAYLWFDASLGEYRYILLENKQRDTATFSIHRLNPYNFAIENTSTPATHNVLLELTKPKQNIAGTTFDVLFLGQETNGYIAVYNYDISLPNLTFYGNINESLTINATMIEFSDFINPNEITPDDTQHYLLIKDRLYSILINYGIIDNNKLNKIIYNITNTYGEPSIQRDKNISIYSFKDKKTKILLLFRFRYNKRECKVYYYASNLFKMLITQ